MRRTIIAIAVLALAGCGASQVPDHADLSIRPDDNVPVAVPACAIQACGHGNAQTSGRWEVPRPTTFPRP